MKFLEDVREQKELFNLFSQDDCDSRWCDDE